MNNLSNRLKEIASFIPDNVKMVDIGCDHALLDIYLYKNRKNIKIIASDINENALEQAKKNIKKYKLDKFIETRLSNGLDNINSDEIDTIVISGMGSHTIVGILRMNQKKLINVDNIIIQSNNHIDFLRERILELNYYIDSEKLVKDNNIIYTIISFKKGNIKYNKKEIYFGPYLLKEDSNLFKEKNKQDLEKLEYLYKIIPKSHILHRIKIKNKINMYKKINNTKKEG